MYNVLKMQEANETRSNSQPNYCCIDVDDDDIKIVKAIVRPADQTDDDEIVCTFMKSSCKTNEVSVIQSIPSGTELPRPQSIEPVEVTNPVTNNPDDSIVELARVEGRSGSANGTHQSGPLSRILNRRRRSRTSGRSSKKQKKIEANEVQIDESSQSSQSSEEQRRKEVRCPICLDDLLKVIDSSVKSFVSTNCGHIFCNICIKEAFKESKLCPTCRKKLTTKQIHPIYFS